MRIGELARLTEVSTTRIRFYEAHGLVPTAGRTDNGYRDYPDSTVETLRLIQGARLLGFSMNDIKAGFAQAGSNPPSKRDMLLALRSKLTSLDRHIADATIRRRRIIELIEKFENESQQPQ